MAKWLPHEIEYLKRNYNTASDQELRENLRGRTIDAIQKHASRLGLTGHRDANPTGLHLLEEVGVETRLQEDREQSRAVAEARYYKRLYAEAVKALNLQDTISDLMKELAPTIPAVTVKTVSLPGGPVIVERGTETDVLQVSDLEGGEKVERDEMVGLDAYDMAIMKQRLETLFFKTIDLVNLRRHSLFIPRLIIAELGDMVSGEIHEELVRTNVAHMMTVSVRVAFLLSQGIAFLSPHFERIDVHCVVGNHGRLRKKKYYKEHYINWDYLCYQWQSVLCRALPNVRFHISRSPYALVNAEETRLLLTHGDPIRSWMGIPWYGIQRAASRLRTLLQAKGDHYDALLLGHFHNRADVDDTVGPLLINGSVKGGSEYSIGSLQTTNKPSQNLLHFHNEYGYIGGEPLYLEPHAQAPKFQDVLPEIWSDLIEEVGGAR